MQLKITLIKLSQSQKDISHVFFHMWFLDFIKICKIPCTYNMEIEMNVPMGPKESNESREKWSVLHS